MNIVDENIVANQRERLHSWHISIRHVGYDIRKQGLLDDAIIPFLLELRRPTFFTRDLDFYNRNLCHRRADIAGAPRSVRACLATLCGYRRSLFRDDARNVALLKR